MNVIKTLAVGLTVTALSSLTAGAQELIYSAHTPDTHSDNTVVARDFFDRITKATDGALTFKIVGGGVLAAGNKALGATKTGAIDATNLIYNYQPSDLPALTFVGDQFSTDARVAAAASTETILQDCPECLEEMKAQNIVISLNVSTTPYNFLCANARIAALADVAGKKLRGTGSMAQLAAALSATPVNITVQEVFEGLQRGQIDCTLMDAGNLEGVQLWDVVKSVTLAPVGTFQSIGFVTLNRDRWNAFTPEQKQAWIDSSAISLAEYERNFIRRVDDAVVKGKSLGIEFIEPEADLTAAIADFRAGELPSLIETAKGRGMKDPEGVAAAYAANSDKWTKIVAEIGEGDWGDAEWGKFTAVVKTEIYSNVNFD